MVFKKCEFYACESNVEYVIDDFINLYGVTPELNFNDNINEVCCEYCHEFAKYVLRFIED